MEPDPQEDFEELLEEYTSDEAIEQALKDKGEGENIKMSPQELIKSLPDVQDRLDLHNHYLDEALRRTAAYIKDSKRNGLQTIEIITGKGRHSENATPILRGKVFEKIMELKREGFVLAAKWNQKKESKSGSIIVYLAQ